jgi:hypothetical protein
MAVTNALALTARRKMDCDRRMAKTPLEIIVALQISGASSTALRYAENPHGKGQQQHAWKPLPIKFNALT